MSFGIAWSVGYYLNESASKLITCTSVWEERELVLPVSITRNHHEKSPCNEHPHTPHFYVVKMGNRSIHVFLFLLQNIDSGYSLEPPQ